MNTLFVVVAILIHLFIGAICAGAVMGKAHWSDAFVVLAFVVGGVGTLAVLVCAFALVMIICVMKACYRLGIKINQPMFDLFNNMLA